jgi:hypothetical protein
MKRHAHTRLASMLGLFVLLGSTAYAQITPSADSYTNTASSTTNHGASTLLDVEAATQVAFIQFNLASIPATAGVSQATLKLYVNGVTTAGSFNVDYVNGAWAENTIDASNAPPLGTTIASEVALTTADKNQYILINVTPAVQAWLNGSETNNGIALVANGTFNATFDSKENTTTSHAPELDIAFAGGEGTITGVTTASGSGLTGGGTSGTLDLSLTNACASKQVLQWSGSTWACSNAGTGTITGVTAGTALTGGGSSGAVTLNLNTSALNSMYAQLGAANTFTGNQTVNGNVSTAGVTTTSTNGGVNSTITGSGNGIAAVTGSATATGAAGFTFGVVGQSASNTGRGVFGNSTGSGGIGVIGENNNGPGFGVVGKAINPSYGSGVYGEIVEPSSTGAAQLTRGGIWGDTGLALPSEVSGEIAAIVGTADDAYSGIFLNNSPTGYSTLVVTALSSASNPFIAGGPGGFCYLDNSGNWDCFGGSNAVVAIDGGARAVAMSAIESPMNWFEDAGSAQLLNGAAVINFDRDFIQTVNAEMDYKVFPVPNGDCKGLYVTNKTATSFEVRELGGGTSNVAFDYRIMAVRRNYEHVRFADHTRDYDSIEQIRREQMKAMAAKPAPHDLTNNPAVDPAKQASATTVPAVRR